MDNTVILYGSLLRDTPNEIVYAGGAGGTDFGITYQNTTKYIEDSMKMTTEV
ncbi:hypothetical protein HAX54_010359, partial [Datura stramonium]|nr:hypothetical protein [Datura stramonium]